MPTSEPSCAESARAAIADIHTLRQLPSWAHWRSLGMAGKQPNDFGEAARVRLSPVQNGKTRQGL